ncbi:hypothetical protein O3U67_02635 [Brevundimonas diminuta]|uniref:hypothetical protein n=1 Tax=Brevundimonas diminuta TaxID=293 RepID=UPI0022B004AF|nr:hypothetical protein [Brevundimonas diminuta]MCZ4106971.1 hypothetical protein [Brevundimonas diminuta]
MPQMKTGALIIAFALATLGAVPAHACLPEPPPLWTSILRSGGPALFIGRVTTVEPLAEPRRTATLEISESKATIERLETIQGQAKSLYTLTAAENVRRLGDYTGMVCVDFQRVKVGDLVLGMETSNGAVRLFEPQQVPPEFTSRIEAYR